MRSEPQQQQGNASVSFDPAGVEPITAGAILSPPREDIPRTKKEVGQT
jgi:hypothetical protein